MTPAPQGSAVWTDAALAAALFAIDPVGLVGITIRGGPGAAREAWLSLARGLLRPDAPVRRVPLNIEDERLIGGLDLAASLALGRPVAQRGVLAEADGGVIILPMVERLDAGVAARIAAVLDQGEVALERDGMASRMEARLGVIALDEGLEPDERPPEALLERLAFHLDLTGLGQRDTAAGAFGADQIAAARIRHAAMPLADSSIIEGLCQVAQTVGVDSSRAVILALRAARAHAALRGSPVIAIEDAAMAARLVLGPRATQAPANDEDDEIEEPPPPPEDQNREDPPPPEDPPGETPPDADRVVEAIAAALPDDLMARLILERAARAGATRSRGLGAQIKAARRGRPVGSRAGAKRAGDRLNLVETLRAATPWQKLRAPEDGATRVQVRREDFRIRRFVQRRESTSIFVVDASGSSAFQRLAEAKGAVELLLAKAYVSRARVALIAFRGTTAELLLPPTRSLTRAKRQLADLPGGGGTPLALAIDAALRLGLAERAADRTPLLIFLTDGRANIGLTGAPGRAAAQADALAAARGVRAAGITAAYLDTSPRPTPDGDRFAREMDAAYAPLPYLDANKLFSVVDTLRGTGR